MATHRILDNFYEHSYVLIAIYSPLEDYRLAYLLNAHICTNFKKLPDIKCYNNTVSFAAYEWEDHKKGSIWNILSNSTQDNRSETMNNATLFGKEIALKVNYLIPEQKNVDYFLRIEGEITQNDTTAVVNTIRNIPKIVSTYTIDPNQLKSKQNLIL